MCTTAVPSSAGEALRLLPVLLGVLAAAEAAGQPTGALAEGLCLLEQSDAVTAAVRGRYLAAFDAHDGPIGDGQRTARAWLVNVTGVTRGQAAEHRAVQALARQHPVLLPPWPRAGCCLSRPPYRCQVDPAHPRRVPAGGRGNPRRRRPGRGGPVGPGRDLRRDPLSHRPARPGRRPGPAPGARRVVRHDVRGRRGDPRRSDPRIRCDGAGGPGRAVRAPGWRGPADPPAAVPRRAR